MKKYFNILLITLVCIITIIIIFCLSSKNIISNAISKYYTRDRLIGNIINIINEETMLSSEKIDILLDSFRNDKDIDEISKKYFEALVDYYSSSNKDLENIDIKEELMNIADNCISKYNINECRIIKDKLNTIDLNHIYTYQVYMVDNNINSDQIVLFKIYKLLTMPMFITLNIIILIDFLLMLFILNKEKLYYLKLYSISSVIISVIGFILIIIINSISHILSNKIINKDYAINVNNLYLIVVGFLILGIIFYMLYKKKKIKI